MATTVNYRFKIAGKSAAILAADNPVPLERELVVETDTGKAKLGDGSTAWNSLPYFLTASSVAWADVSGKPANLTAIGGLTTAADTLTYWTGSSAAAQTSITSFARSILDDSNAATARTTLGAAASGANSDISSLTGLTTPLSDAQGGTGGSTTGSGAFVRATAPNLADANLRQTYPTLNFRNGAGTRYGYFQHDSSDMLIVVDVGDMVLGANVRSYVDAAHNLGSASLRWNTIYASTGTINTSDEREKVEISAIPDAWLDAWGEVEWCRFKFVGRKRWHVGLIAQRVHLAFRRHGIDAFEIGLLCLDRWAAVRARKERRNKQGEVVRAGRAAAPGGTRWGLRYDECQALEAAWQRRELARLRAMI